MLGLLLVFVGIYHSQQGVKCYATKLLSEVRRTLRMLNTESCFVANGRLKFGQEPEERGHLKNSTNLPVI